MRKTPACEKITGRGFCNSSLGLRHQRDHLEHAAGNPSAPSGQLPLHKGAFFSRDTQPPASPQTPPIRPSKGESSTAPERPTCSIEGQGEMPKRGTPLGCSLVLSRSEKEQEPYPRCRNHAATRNPQSCFIATKRTPPKLLPLSPQGTPLPYEGKLKTPKRYRKTNGCEPSQSPAVTALPEGEPRGRADLRLRGACGRQSLSPCGAAPFTQGSLIWSTKLN